MEQTYDLLALNKFLLQTLAFTEEVKHILKSDCEEAIFSLKPWCKKIIVKQEDAANACTCFKSEIEVEEIAAGISRTLLQTQQLREKLSLNVIKEKNHLKQPNLSKIYNPHAFGDGRKKEDKTLSTSNNKLPTVAAKNENKNTDKTKNSTKQLAAHSKFVRNKNFLAINKRNIKTIPEVKKHKNINQKLDNNSKSSCSITKTECLRFDNRSSTASPNELKNLIERLSSQSSNSTLSNKEDAKCPIHGTVPSQVVYKQSFITMDVIDSINTFNIPGDIIKPLKAYHTYLNTKFSDKPLDNGKRQKMLNTFLTEFNKMNNLQIRKSDVQKTFIYNDSDMAGWMSNGIWNLFYTRYFEGISKVQCIQYTSRNQLLSFFEMTQQLQQIQYVKDLVDIISEEILPSITVSFDSAKPEYIKIYKMICILCQGLNPKIPVLVRTDV
ncbi:PREDICTED: uncharacterized protein LOC107187631 [Dufourea novaeangliae]|uniref:uncharacterized protein LOC107187631 n=1 Tax=Dufourea novaeangliae TaxID=178035 RepID=UPI000767C116|nr:PREDICTED: uncharacterized protein LOC107187631 [Dufourea novaeangliae]